MWVEESELTLAEEVDQAITCHNIDSTEYLTASDTEHDARSIREVWSWRLSHSSSDSLDDSSFVSFSGGFVSLPGPNSRSHSANPSAKSASVISLL